MNISFSPPSWLGKFLFWLLPNKLKHSMSDQASYNGTARRTLLGGLIEIQSIHEDKKHD